jgi:hypothetical protein
VGSEDDVKEVRTLRISRSLLHVKRYYEDQIRGDGIAKACCGDKAEENCVQEFGRKT